MSQPPTEDDEDRETRETTQKKWMRKMGAVDRTARKRRDERRRQAGRARRIQIMAAHRGDSPVPEQGDTRSIVEASRAATPHDGDAEFMKGLQIHVATALKVLGQKGTVGNHACNVLYLFSRNCPKLFYEEVAKLKAEGLDTLMRGVMLYADHQAAMAGLLYCVVQIVNYDKLGAHQYLHKLLPVLGGYCTQMYKQMGLQLMEAVVSVLIAFFDAATVPRYIQVKPLLDTVVTPVLTLNINIRLTPTSKLYVNSVTVVGRMLQRTNNTSESGDFFNAAVSSGYPNCLVMVYRTAKTLELCHVLAYTIENILYSDKTYAMNMFLEVDFINIMFDKFKFFYQVNSSPDPKMNPNLRFQALMGVQSTLKMVGHICFQDSNRKLNQQQLDMGRNKRQDLSVATTMAAAGGVWVVLKGLTHARRDVQYNALYALLQMVVLGKKAVGDCLLSRDHALPPSGVVETDIRVPIAVVAERVKVDINSRHTSVRTLEYGMGILEELLRIRNNAFVVQLMQAVNLEDMLMVARQHGNKSVSGLAKTLLGLLDRMGVPSDDDEDTVWDFGNFDGDDSNVFNGKAPVSASTGMDVDS